MLKFTPAAWIIGGLILAALEMVVPGFVLLWFGVAAVVTGILALFVHNWVVQLAVFAGLSAALVLTSQLISRRLTKPEPEPVGANRMRGVEGRVVRDIEASGFGRVKVGGEEWRATADQAIAVGKRVKVIEVEGTHLVVEPVSEGSE
jgi:membrane protein implicated in regulation of membrane protease activity